MAISGLASYQGALELKWGLMVEAGASEAGWSGGRADSPSSLHLPPTYMYTYQFTSGKTLVARPETIVYTDAYSVRNAG